MYLDTVSQIFNYVRCCTIYDCITILQGCNSQPRNWLLTFYEKKGSHQLSSETKYVHMYVHMHMYICTYAYTYTCAYEHM
jgi:hypothetical protein